MASREKAVVVAGVRTPFVKAFTEFTRLDTIALAKFAVEGLLRKTEIDRALIESVVWGGVILPSASPRLCRRPGTRC